jgi:hypothetical protein
MENAWDPATDRVARIGRPAWLPASLNGPAFFGPTMVSLQNTWSEMMNYLL